ncbi:MAG: hypothetical protein WC356_04575 [Candidatus Micrarchaeia archaeon]|jgi:hypothetical protein
MGRKLGYIGIDQYGTSYRGLKYPRKDLLDKLGRKHADKMWADVLHNGVYEKNEPKRHHIGYIIAGLWIRVYTVYDWGKYE